MILEFIEQVSKYALYKTDQKAIRCRRLKLTTGQLVIILL